MGGAGLLQHRADQLAGDGDAVAVLLVALAVEEERRDDDDVASRGESETEEIQDFNERATCANLVTSGNQDCKSMKNKRKKSINN